MEAEEIDALRSNYCDLIRCIDVRDVIDNLYQTHALSEEEIQDILEQKTSRERNRKLLYILRHRPSDRQAYLKFQKALSEDYDFLAEKMRSSLKQKVLRPAVQENALKRSEQESKHQKQLMNNTENKSNPNRKTDYSGDQFTYSNGCQISSPNKHVGKNTITVQSEYDASGFSLNKVESTDENDGFNMYPLTRGFLHSEPFEGHLSDAFQVIHQDPVTCAGKSSGWMHVNEARRLNPMLTGSDAQRSLRLRHQAINHYQRALDNFQAERSKDGPFGYYFALIKLAQMKFCCGDYMQTVDLQPPEEDIQDAELRLEEAASSSFPFPALLRMNLCMTRSDLCYRRHNIVRAVLYAEEAHAIATEAGCAEEQRFTQARLTCYGAILDKARPVSEVIAKNLQPNEDQGYESAEIHHNQKLKIKRHQRSGSNGQQTEKLRRRHSNDEDETNIKTISDRHQSRSRKLSSRNQISYENKTFKYKTHVPEQIMMNNSNTINSLLGIVALVILFVLVIWQSILLHLK